jgi:hypothetical protein
MMNAELRAAAEFGFMGSARECPKLVVGVADWLY